MIYGPINQLKLEMGIKKQFDRVERVELDKNIQGARLFLDDKLYGVMVLVSYPEDSAVQSCAYKGRYPGLTGPQSTDEKNKEQVILDTQMGYPTELSQRTGLRVRGLIRNDYNQVPFLGVPYKKPLTLGEIRQMDEEGIPIDDDEDSVAAQHLNDLLK